MSPIDQSIRDQAVDALDTSIALSAGAGSGKTTVLTSRVLHLLTSGVDPARIAAITFTEKATSELLERLRDGLEAARRADPDDPVLSRALARFGELRVSTIHSFCQTLLTLEALASRWAPDTEMVASALTVGPLSQAWRTWRRGFDARHPDAALLLRLTIWRGTLRTGADTLVAFRDLEPHRAPAPLTATQARDRIQELERELRQAVAACRVPESDKLVQNNAELAQDLARLAQADPADVLPGLLACSKGSKSGGRAADWGPPGKQGVKDVVDAVRALKGQVLAGLHALVVADLSEHYLPAVEQAKAGAALADYDDLLFRARDLLAGHPGARARLAGAFDALLIDEVQDTDPIQAEVAALLARDAEQDGPWHQAPPLPGRLFAVGDPRQSIYRFRRADVATWNRLVDLVTSRGQTLALQQNFRSVPGVVDWVNHTFADLDGYVPQTAAREPGPLPPVVALPLTLPEGAQDLNKRDAARLCWPLEQDAIVRHLRALQGQHVVDRETGQERPLRWSDVMILTPAWRPASELAAHLTQAGIPALVEGGRTFFSRPEVQACLHALRALAEPSDTEALVAVLRELWGLTLADLAQHLHDGGALRYTMSEQPAGPVAHALRTLNSLHRARGRTSLVALLDALLDRTRTRATWALLPDRDARLANLDRLEAHLRQAEAHSRHPAEAVELLQSLQDQDDEGEQALADDDLRAVRLTTVFSAKGREAPVVILAHNRRSAGGVSVARDPDGGRVAVKIGDLAPPDWDRWKDAERAALDAERWRWMYVACTRARDQLVLPVWPMQATSSTDLTHTWLMPGLPGVFSARDGQTLPVGDGASVLVRNPDAYPAPDTLDGPFGEHTAAVQQAVQQVLSDPSADPSVDRDGRTWAQAWQAARESAKQASTRWKTVTELARESHSDASASTHVGIGIEGGALVHEVLEVIDLQSEQRADQAHQTLRALAFERGTPADLIERVQHVLARILSHRVFNEIGQAPEVWREVPFGIQDQGTQVHGVIDCAYPLDASRTVWRVIDWKSDLPPEGDPKRAVYQRQVELYAKAVLRTVATCDEVHATLVGPHPELGEGVEVEEDGEDVAHGFDEEWTEDEEVRDE